MVFLSPTSMVPAPLPAGEGSGRIYLLTNEHYEVRYVGATFQKAHTRLTAHRSAKTAVGEWVRSCQPLILVVDRAPDRPRLHERERAWIEHWRRLGARLLNQ